MNAERRWLRPLVPVYAAALAAKRGLRRMGLLRERRLEHTVLSIGSLSAGGAGKTPLVLAMARMLDRRGYAVRILTRGYGREANTVERVDPAGDAARFGDEPLLLARSSGVPVYVGADRHAAGLLAEAEADGGRLVHLLDDGFQHRQLARNLDIVLLTREDVDDRLLPAGNLREPLSRLRAADVVVLREEERDDLEPFVQSMVRQDGDPPVIWTIRRRLVLPPGETGGGDTTAAPPTSRPLAFCGIARPAGFRAMLAQEGFAPVDMIAFPDHHAHTAQDVERLVREARRLDADSFVTTEKDAVKLTPGMRRELESVGPLLVPQLLVDLLEERAAIETTIGRVERMDRRRRIE